MKGMICSQNEDVIGYRPTYELFIAKLTWYWSFLTLFYVSRSNSFTLKRKKNIYLPLSLRQACTHSRFCLSNFFLRKQAFGWEGKTSLRRLRFSLPCYSVEKKTDKAVQFRVYLFSEPRCETASGRLWCILATELFSTYYVNETNHVISWRQHYTMTHNEKNKHI